MSVRVVDGISIDLRSEPDLDDLADLSKEGLIHLLSKTRGAWWESEKAFLKIQAAQSDTIAALKATVRTHERHLLVEAKRVGLAVVDAMDIEGKF